MDNTELHYVTYDPEEIWNEMMVAYVEAGGDILYPGDEKEILLRSVQADFVQVFAAVDNALRMATRRYATGDYLDILGDARGCPRIEATAAMATVTITTNATARSGTLTEGTALSADGERFYLLAEDVTLSGFQETLTALIVAAEEGSAGNGLLAGTQMFLAVPNANVNSITVLVAANGGSDREDDETYRERIGTHGLASTTTGPAQQYESVAEAVSADVIDAHAMNLGGGKVGVYLILRDGADKQAVLQAVLGALSPDDVRPLNDLVYTYEAEEVPYTLDVRYATDGGSTVKAVMAEALSEYREWQDNTIGRAFNPDRLMAALYQAGATRVVFADGSGIGDDGAATYTEIAENARCRGTITLGEL